MFSVCNTGREHRARTGNGWNGEREDRRVAAARRQLDFFFWFALAENHREGKQKQDDSPGYLERREGDVHGREDDFPSYHEEQQNHRRSHGRFDCDSSLDLLFIAASDRDEHRYRSDRVDHGKEDDECCGEIVH